MKKEISFFRCKHCGNIITFVKDAGVPVICCGEPMSELKANTTDAVQEKHVPDITKEDGSIFVRIGSITHPMLEEHYIEWIACVSGNTVQFKYLEPGEEPEASFTVDEEGTVYEYCNIHGLWKAEF